MSERLTLRTPRRPNVVWIFGDQHRSHATSYRGDGNVFTPNIDNYVRLWRPVVDAICAREGYRLPTDRGSRVEHQRGVHPRPARRDQDLQPVLDGIRIRARIDLLARDGEVPVPAIRAAGVFRDRTDWSYLAMQFCAGRPLDELQPELARQALLEVAAETGRMVRAARRRSGAGGRRRQG